MAVRTYYRDQFVKISELQEAFLNNLQPASLNLL